MGLQGFARATKDVDICCARSDENLTKLAAALKDVNARLRGVEDLPVPLDARMLKDMMIATLNTTYGALDCLAEPDDAPSYAEMKARAKRLDIGSFAVQVVSIEDPHLRTS